MSIQCVQWNPFICPKPLYSGHYTIVEIPMQPCLFILGYNSRFGRYLFPLTSGYTDNLCCYVVLTRIHSPPSPIFLPRWGLTSWRSLLLHLKIMSNQWILLPLTRSKRVVMRMVNVYILLEWIKSHTCLLCILSQFIYI